MYKIVLNSCDLGYANDLVYVNDVIDSFDRERRCL